MNSNIKNEGGSNTKPKINSEKSTPAEREIAEKPITRSTPIKTHSPSKITSTTPTKV